jgi:chaperonin GroES
LATSVIPLSDHIVLQSTEAEAITASGLVIPESAKEKPQHGDRVLYQKYTGQEVTVENEDYIIIRFQDVLAKLVDGGNSSKRGGK